MELAGTPHADGDALREIQKILYSTEVCRSVFVCFSVELILRSRTGSRCQSRVPSSMKKKHSEPDFPYGLPSISHTLVFLSFLFLLFTLFAIAEYTSECLGDFAR